MSIKYSIIIPTYNCMFIENAIDSVINQTYKSWELIVIDNNSKDNVQNLIKKKKNKKIKYFKIKNNGIIGKSRNLGIKKSKNSWIAFLDSDDIWYKNKLEIINNEIIKNESDIIYHNMHISSEAKNFFNKKLYNYEKKKIKNKFDDLIINGNDIIQSSVVVKKNIIKKVRYISEEKKLVTWEDYDLWLKISQITNKFTLINKCLGKYYISNDKKIKHKRFIANIKSFKQKYRSSIKKILIKYRLKEIWWVKYAHALNYYNEKNYSKAKQKLSLIKTNNKKISYNIFYIKFKIFLKTFL